MKRDGLGWREAAGVTGGRAGVGSLRSSGGSAGFEGVWTSLGRAGEGALKAKGLVGRGRRLDEKAVLASLIRICKVEAQCRGDKSPRDGHGGKRDTGLKASEGGGIIGEGVKEDE
ncbi:MAG: hypothetical protein ACQKBU_05045 [Verrucomicrobiales bacterium]